MPTGGGLQPASIDALFGGKGLPPYRMSQLFVGRHPYADRRGLQPASIDALFGGKGLPPYRMSQLFVGRHPYADRRGGCNLQALTPCLAAKGYRPTFIR